MKLTPEEAVLQVYRGKSNMIIAARAAEIDVSELKHLLLKMIQKTPINVCHQLALPLKNEQEKSTPIQPIPASLESSVVREDRLHRQKRQSHDELGGRSP